MRIKTVGNKSDIVAVVVKNTDTVTMPIGSPVILSLADGQSVVLPSTAGATLTTQQVYGVLIAPTNLSGGLPVNGIGESQVYGFCNQLIFTSQTRTATTGANSWATQASIASLAMLIPETVGNGWTTVATGLIIPSGSTGQSISQQQFPPIAQLAVNIATQAGSATSTSDTRLVVTLSVKAFLRML